MLPKPPFSVFAAFRMQGNIVRLLSEVHCNCRSRKATFSAACGEIPFAGSPAPGCVVYPRNSRSTTVCILILCAGASLPYFPSPSPCHLPIPRDVTNTMTDGPSLAPKRSLFKKPNWAAKSTSISKAETDFFDHRDSTYSGILAEKEKRRKKHRDKAATQVQDHHGHEPKKQRLSADEDSDSETESSDSKENAHTGDGQFEGPITRSTPAEKAPPANPGPDFSTKQYSPTKPFNAANTRIIDLEDKEDQAHPMRDPLLEPKNISPTKARPKPPPSDPESEDEDEYTLELKRKAREKARLRKLGLDASRSMTPEPTTMKNHSPQHESHSQSNSVQSPTEAPLRKSPTPFSTPKKEDDVKVMIYIRTAIPDTNELIVNRWASQNLQQVKEAWCKRQGFDVATARKVFLTWRGNKLFNTTTLTHILQTLKAEKKKSSLVNLDSDDEDSDPSKGRIEVEAMTEDILIERKRLKEKEGWLADASTGDEKVSAEDGGEPQPPQEPDIQLMLNSPGLESVLLKVRPTTLVSKIMAGFKKIRGVEQGKNCWLIFDGERLDPDIRISDTEIEDGDAVDVQIR